MGELYSNFYSILNVSPNSSMNEIKKQYRKLVLKYHPDLNKNPEAEEMFKKITKAFQILSNPKTRLKYDSSIMNEKDEYFVNLSLKDYIKKINLVLKSNFLKSNKNIRKEELISIDSYTLNLSLTDLYQRIVDSDNVYVKKVAILAMLQKNLNSSYIFLLKALKNEKNPEVIIFALNFMIEKYGKKLFYDIYFLKDHQNQDVKLYLIDLCKENICLKSEEILKELLNDRDPLIRIKALNALKANNPESLLNVIYNLIADEDKIVKSEALKIYEELKKILV
jgi:hypothetical protein